MSDGPIVSKEAFLKGNIGEETIDIPDLGPVRIRGLSRAEWLANKDRDGEEWEIGLLAGGLLEPKLTDEELRQWRTVASVKLVDEVASAILRASGMLKSQVGEAKRSFPEG